MIPSISAALTSAVDNEAPREQRAAAATEMILQAGDYRSVGIYDVGDDQVTRIGYRGSPGQDEHGVSTARGLGAQAMRTRATAASDFEAVVPILGAESALVIGMLAVESKGGASSKDAIAFLEDCAAALRPLYD
jgi:hypothetical protein